MKRALIYLCVLIVLAACGTVSTSADRGDRFTDHDSRLTVTTDLETGCKYIVYHWKTVNSGVGGITPRMLPDGTQDCVVND